MMKKLIVGLLMLGIAGLLTGCEAWREAWEESGDTDSGRSFWSFEKYTPKYVMGVFRVVKHPRASSMEREISTYDGRTVWINNIQMISSQNFKEIRLLPRPDRPDRYDLSVKLDERGKHLWILMAADYRDQELAVMIDSVFYGTFRPTQLETETDDWVTIAIDRSFDEVTAAGLQRYAKENYGHFNPSPSSFW